jgi:hypothetical protein
MSDVLSLIEAERAVRQTVVAMTRAFDDEDWPTVSTFLSADLSADFAEGSIRGADAMLTMMKHIAAQRQAAGTRYMHDLGHMIVTVCGDEAQASAFHVAYLYRAGEVSSPVSKSGSRGTYRLRLESGAWRIIHLSSVRLWLEGEPY